MTTLMLIWDYDTPTGFDVSDKSRGADPMSEYTCTERILGLLGEHGIVSTFACVGRAAEAGPLPYHNPTQIRAIHAAGHEIASHSHDHELIPTLNRRELLETCRASKAALEDCIGAEVTGFVPPWNRPFHHPRKLAFSGSDWREGGHWWKQSVDSLCAVLGEAGYRWVRVLYAPLWEQVVRQVRPERRRAIQPAVVDCLHGVYTLRLSYCGYDEAVTKWLAAENGRDALLILYAHPHAIEHSNSQHWQHLTSFLRWYTDHKKQHRVSFTTPSEWLSKRMSHFQMGPSGI
jgi:peptidoglycan/xylan/chitin deacetylase (PgdA/CDA1 family)